MPPWPPPLQDADARQAPITQGTVSEPNGLLLPPVHDLATTVEYLQYQRTKTTLIALRWECAPWYIDAKAAVHRTKYCPTVQTTTIVKPFSH